MKDELLLVWRRPKNEQGNRRRYVVGRLSRIEEAGVEKFKFCYGDDFGLAKEEGLELFPGFGEPEKVYESDNLFVNVLARLPRTDRSDYLDILNLYGLNKGTSDWELLKATKGRLLTDNFEFVPAFDSSKIEFDVAGIRHRKTSLKQLEKYLKVDAKVLLEVEPDNEFDSNAIKVVLPIGDERCHIGYVPRYYSRELVQYARNVANYSALVSKVNIDAKNDDDQLAVKVRLLLD